MTRPHVQSRRLTAADYSVDAVTAAKALIGAFLCRRLDDGTVLRRRITETEAYCGEEDTACHAHKGRTPRTDVMYSPGGCAYIYLCYGMHEILNIVTGAEGRPEAVLIRGIEGVTGPGRLTKLLQIDRTLNREDLKVSKRLWLESDGAPFKFTAAPRIGIAYASKRDQSRKWRFTLRSNEQTLEVFANPAPPIAPSGRPQRPFSPPHQAASGGTRRRAAASRAAHRE